MLKFPADSEVPGHYQAVNTVVRYIVGRRKVLSGGSWFVCGAVDNEG